MPASFYRITVSNPGGLSAPSDGFIDQMTIQHYLTNLEAPPVDFTFSLSTAKSRANQRFAQVVQQLALLGNLYIDASQTSAPGAGYNSEASAITILVSVEHGDDSLVTVDETNSGPALTGSAALVRAVARALVMAPVRSMDVFDPTATTTPGNTKLVARFGDRIAPVTVGAVAANLAAASALVSTVKVF